MKKILDFIKYNNATLLIVLIVFVLGTSVFASETGREALGQKQTTTQGVDNTLLLSSDLDKMNMDFKVENVTDDADYYYVTYTFLDLDLNESKDAWQFQMKEKQRKISKQGKDDLGQYLAEEFKELYLARIKELKASKEKAMATGEQKRVEVTEYSGLIGRVLDVAGGVFPGYEPVIKKEIASPDQASFRNLKESENTTATSPDNITSIYNKYITENDQDHDNFFGKTDNCPDVSNPSQLDSDNDGIGDACDSEVSAPSQTQATDPSAPGDASVNSADNPETTGVKEDTSNVEVIDLSQPSGDPEPASQPAPESTPAPQTDTGAAGTNPSE
jgi:hypothetical protein